MLKRIIKLIRPSKKKNPKTFFDMSSAQQKKLLTKAVREANKEQMKVVRDYEKKFGIKVDLGKCNP